jgi:hypothetical protein
MMNNDGTFASPRSPANTAAIAISLQDLLSQPAKILVVLPFQGVAGCTKTERKYLLASASAMQRLALNTIHESTANPRRPFEESNLHELAIMCPGT